MLMVHVLLPNKHTLSYVYVYVYVHVHHTIVSWTVTVTLQVMILCSAHIIISLFLCVWYCDRVQYGYGYDSG
jgi:hypothetical protein